MKDTLIKAMDEAALGLLNAVNGTKTESPPGETSQPVDIKGRTAAFQAVTAYLAVKHKIEPEGGKTSGIDKYRSAINGRTTGRGAGSSANQDGSAGTETDT